MSTNPSFVVSCNAILKPSKWGMETCHINDPFHPCLEVFLFIEGCRTKTRRDALEINLSLYHVHQQLLDRVFIVRIRFRHDRKK